MIAHDILTPFNNCPGHLGSPKWRSIVNPMIASSKGRAAHISSPPSSLAAHVTPTGEELMIARDTVDLLESRRAESSWLEHDV